LLAVCASSALAARVIVLSADGHATVRNDPFVPDTAVTPAPGPAAPVAPEARVASSRKRRRPVPPSVQSDLARYNRTGAITRAAFRSYSTTLNQAIASRNRLRGTREYELEAVITNMHAIAVANQLTPSRLPALFETLARNRQWWTTGPLLASGQRVEFAGSQLVWEYYPGQGIELQVLGSFGKADGLYTGGPADYPALGQLLAEIVPLASDRGGGLTWEYYFSFDGGRPPWTSAMSQGTAIEALTRAYEAFHDSAYLSLAHRALAIFNVAPPTGVRVSTPLGARYLQYSFTPGTSIINAFLQSLIGLYDYAQVSSDPEAQRLFAAGNAEAMAEVPHFDTGAWSLYQPGIEDTLSYHELVTGFLQELCSRTGASVYCTTAQHFSADLTTPPTLALLTGRARVKHAFSIAFRLSKISHVGIVVLRGSQVVFETSAYFPYGVHTFAIPPLGRKGTYTVHLAATDLAGNFNRIVGSLSLK
jgi:D-glucuronyl C5-epimerase C-terminus